MKGILIVFILFMIQIESSKSNIAIQDSIVFLRTEQSVDGYTSYYSNFIGDTTINGNVYQVLRNQAVTIPGLFTNPYLGGQYDVYERYDSTNEIVYCINPLISHSESVLYNYKMNLGDTLKPWSYILTTIDSVRLENLTYRKRFIFTDSIFSVIWIKGIGNIATPLEQYGYIDGGFNILCYHENGILLYQYQNIVPIQCDNFSLVNEISSSKKISIYPNPFERNVNIDSPEKINELDVYNTTGQKLFALMPDENNFQVYFGNFKTGIYYLKFYLSNGEIIYRKVSKSVE
jgi:hypothetical protein